MVPYLISGTFLDLIMKGFVDVTCFFVLLELKTSNKKFMMIKEIIIKVIANIIWDNI